MTIRVRKNVEPLSLASRTVDPLRPVQASIIESDAYRQVARDLEAYVDGEILGRSFLVAGHRGAGKTTMLRYAVQDVDSRIRRRGETARKFARPLFIPLHGPDLLAPPPAQAPDGAKNGAQAAQTVPAAAPPAPPPPDELRHFLDRITSGLYFGAAQEFAARFREHAERVGTSQPDRAELRELAADLQVQLDRQPDLDRLRDYWRRVDALNGGVLFEAATDPGRGLSEVTALFSVGRVMRTLAGKTEASLETLAKRAQEGSISLVTIDGQNVLPALIGLLTGAAVWTALPGAAPLVKSLSSLITGFGALLGLKVGATRSRGTSQTWKETYIPDNDPGSLYRVLPGLIERFQQVGLFPVFVVDELDKVPGLGQKINALLGYMKQFVTERAFFCFVANRSFYQQANAQAAASAYSALHTRFGDTVFVRYDPEDFHKYLTSILDVPDGLDPVAAALAADAAAMLRYLLMSRSYLHPYDLRRELAQWQAGDGTILVADAEILGRRRHRLEVVAQIAVEVACRATELEEYLTDSLTAQTVIDALYYPIRMWRHGAEEVDVSYDTLRKHLIDRTGIQEEEETPGVAETPRDQLVPPDLVKVLVKHVDRVMTLMSAPQTLAAAAQGVNIQLPEAIVKMLAGMDAIVEKV